MAGAAYRVAAHDEARDPVFAERGRLVWVRRLQCEREGESVAAGHTAARILEISRYLQLKVVNQ